MTYQLFNHQKELLNLLTENDRYLVLADTGTGKTLPLCIHISNLFLAGDIENALIVAPLSGLGAWSRDIEKLSKDRQRVMKDRVTFINYDKLSRKDSRYQRECGKTWDLILLDEGHAISNPSSNRTQYFVGRGKSAGIAQEAKYRYLLTGTLITNSRLEDLWSPLRFILDDWCSHADFKKDYLVTKYLPGTYVPIIIGYRHREELLDIVAQHSYRVLKKDCLDLPEEMPDEIIKVPFAKGKNAPPFNKTTAELYNEALESYVEALDMVSDNPLTRLLRLRQVATGHIKESDTRDENGTKVKGMSYDLKCDKSKYALELIENNLPNKTVVFYQFTASCRELERVLKKAKIAYITLNGLTKDKNCWKQFQSDESIKVILVQYQSGSSAIDLFASSYTIYYEPTNSSHILEQSRARTHRNGQKQACNYTFLLTEGTIEEDMYNALAKHQDFNEELYRDVARLKLKGKLSEDNN